MDEMDLASKCYREVSKALAHTLGDLQPMLEAKYPIGGEAIRHSVAQALINNAVEVYTETSQLNEEQHGQLCDHVEYLIWGVYV